MDFNYAFDGIHTTSFKKGDVVELSEKNAREFRKLEKVTIYNKPEKKSKKGK